MRRVLVIAVVLCLVSTSLSVAAVRGKEVKYVGGTIASIKENTEGRLDLDGVDAVFRPKKSTTELSIAYNRIDSLEYGQKAGRRVGVALAVNPLFLFSKKRKHYLTIGFADADGKKQGAVFELSKGIVKETLNVFETKSGKPVEYESEEAKKHVSGD